MEGLEKRPGERFQSAQDLAFALQTLASGSTPSAAAKPESAAPVLVRARNGPVLIGAGLAMLGLAALAGWVTRTSMATSPPVYRAVPLAVEEAAETTPAWSRDGKTLAYSAEAGGDYQIFTRQPDKRGGSPAQLTTLPQDALYPFWHPSGDRIYFLVTPENSLWVVGAAGGQPERLVEDVDAAAISPDGAALLYSRRRELWVASADGKNPIRGPELPASVLPRTIKFSPDGTMVGIAYAQGALADLLLADYPFSGGASPWRVVQYERIGGALASFDWMPDGRQVMLQIRTEAGSSELRLGDLTSPRLAVVAQPETFYATPSVSPDGGRIAYAATRLNWDIRQIDLATGRVSPLVTSSLYDGWPAWLPSGDQLAYSTTRSGRSEIWTTSLREGWSRPVLTADDFTDESTRLLVQPAVAPNGRAIAFQRLSASGVHLFVSALAGGKPVRLDPSAARQDSPSWSPDGNWIAFVSQGTLQKVRVGGGSTPTQLRDDVVGTSQSYTRWSRTGQILYLSREGLTMIGDAGTNPQVLSTERLLLYDWAPDGLLVWAIRETNQRQLELVTLDPRTRQIRLVAALGLLPVSPDPGGVPNTIRALTISPDGTKAAFAYLHPDSDIWMLERVKE